MREKLLKVGYRPPSNFQSCTSLASVIMIITLQKSAWETQRHVGDSVDTLDSF